MIFTKETESRATGSAFVGLPLALASGNLGGHQLLENPTIGLRENLNRKPMAFYHQIVWAFRCKFSHHPILWKCSTRRVLLTSWKVSHNQNSGEYASCSLWTASFCLKIGYPQIHWLACLFLHVKIAMLRIYTLFRHTQISDWLHILCIPIYGWLKPLSKPHMLVTSFYSMLMVNPSHFKNVTGSSSMFVG